MKRTKRSQTRAPKSERCVTESVLLSTAPVIDAWGVACACLQGSEFVQATFKAC